MALKYSNHHHDEEDQVQVISSLVVERVQLQLLTVVPKDIEINYKIQTEGSKIEEPCKQPPELDVK